MSKFSSPLDKWMYRARIRNLDLSRKAGVDPSHIGNVRRTGKGGFRQSVLGKIAVVLADRIEGATVGDVLTGLVCPEADDWCPPVGGET